MPMHGQVNTMNCLTGCMESCSWAHLTEEHQADPERAAAQSTFTNSLKLLRQARERLGQGLRAVEAGTIGESDEISLRNP